MQLYSPSCIQRRQILPQSGMEPTMAINRFRMFSIWLPPHKRCRAVDGISHVTFATVWHGTFRNCENWQLGSQTREIMRNIGIHYIMSSQSKPDFLPLNRHWGFQCRSVVPGTGSSWVFEAVDGAQAKVCRGSHPNDNSNSYFELSSASNITDCLTQCFETSLCALALDILGIVLLCYVGVSQVPFFQLSTWFLFTVSVTTVIPEVLVLSSTRRGAVSFGIARSVPATALMDTSAIV